MNKAWEEINDHYCKAKEALFGHDRKDGTGWCRDEDAGYYHMWNAYYKALKAEDKDHLLYGKILMMLHHQTMWTSSEYEHFHKYVKPAYEQYQKAIEAGEKITDKELESIRKSHDYLNYYLEKHGDFDPEWFKLMDGYEKIPELFSFHDSKVMDFCFNLDTARMVLELDHEIQVTLEFEVIWDIKVQTDPAADWIQEFYCYRDYYIKDRVVFDIGFYRIVCDKIIVEDVKIPE